jgi:allophanate hydrolase subunit 2
MIDIIRAGALASVQDQGRFGYRRYGVCGGGALDRLALAIGNRMLDNAPDCAAIEFTLGRATVRFQADMRVALTGAETRANLDGRPVWSWHAFNVRKGDMLTLPAAQGGTRTYLCVAGGVDVPPVLARAAPISRPALAASRAARCATATACRQAARASTPNRPAWACRHRHGRCRCHPKARPSPCACCLASSTNNSTPLRRKRSGRRTGPSRRTATAWGFRLQGPALARRPDQSADLLSHGVLPGVMQVPPAGQPIALMADAQTTGGYPKIGVVIEADLWRLAQVPLGALVRFKRVTPDEAAAAQAELDRYVRQIGQALQWQGAGLSIAARRRAKTRAA